MSNRVNLDEAWRMYLSIRVHYMDRGYDAVEAKGRLANQKTLQSRPDKVLLRASLSNLESIRDVVEYCASNFLNENDSFLYESSDVADGYYASWKSFWLAPERNLRNCSTQIELSMYKSGLEKLDDYVRVQLHKDVYMNKVNRETLCILESQEPGILGGMTGFEKDRLVLRVQKTNRFIPRRLANLERVNLRQMIEGNFK